MSMVIDTSFDFRTDAGGRDADAYSPTLRKYHKLLWSKALPCGRRFDLTDTVSGVYLHHSSDVGKFFLCSDSIMHTYTRWTSLKHITGLFPEEENEAFRTIAYTIGGYRVRRSEKSADRQIRWSSRVKPGAPADQICCPPYTPADICPATGRFAASAVPPSIATSPAKKRGIRPVG